MASKRRTGHDGSELNLDVLVRAGVIVEPERLTDAEIEAVNGLSEVEVSSLISAFKQISKVALNGKKGLWRSFIF